MGRHMNRMLPLVFLSFASPLSAFKSEDAAVEAAFMAALSLVYSVRR